jgi:hypothetical protein
MRGTAGTAASASAIVVSSRLRFQRLRSALGRFLLGWRHLSAGHVEFLLPASARFNSHDSGQHRHSQSLRDRQPRPYIRAVHFDFTGEETAALIKELHDAVDARGRRRSRWRRSLAPDHQRRRAAREQNTAGTGALTGREGSTLSGGGEFVLVFREEDSNGTSRHSQKHLRADPRFLQIARGIILRAGRIVAWLRFRCPDLKAAVNPLVCDEDQVTCSPTPGRAGLPPLAASGF